MNQEPQYITYLSVDEMFSVNECQKILNETDLEDPQEAFYLVTDLENPTPAQTPKVRYLKKTENNAWIGTRIEELILANNPETYNFDISIVDELHLLEWTENYYFDMHYDIGPGIASTRKISFMVFLNDRKDYTGGELTFHLLQHSSKQKIPDDMGLLLFFSSYKPFKSEPVTNGKRYVLVGWVHGNHFS